MLTEDQVRQDLDEIRTYYSMRDLFDKAPREIKAEALFEKLEQYHSVMRKAPAKLYVLYVALYVNNSTQVVVAEEWAYTISDSGYTEILASYYGYPGITTGGVVTTKLQKKNGDTWTDVDEWVEEVTGDTFYQVYTLQLSTRGNYKVTIEYRVSGTGGPDDIIEEELLRTY